MLILGITIIITLMRVINHPNERLNGLFDYGCLDLSGK